jgi:hypothetical protein
MKRWFSVLLALGLVCGAAGALHADVKTQEKTQIKFGGMLGRMMGMFGGKAAKEGVVSTVAVKGDRLMRVTGRTGQIIDLAEEKIYDLDMRKKTYTVTTFAELRQKLEEAKARAEKAAKEQPEAKEQEPEEPEQPAKEMEVDYDVKETGKTKTIAGHETKEYIITVTVREKGKTLEDGGGMVLTADTWMAEKIPALDEVNNFNRRYYQELGGPAIAGGSEEQMAAAWAMYPGIKTAMAGLEKQNVKMDGSALETTLTVEGVKSKEEMAQAASQESGSEGGGLGGMFARKLMRKKAEDAGPRSTVFTSTNEVLSVDASAGDADVAIPAGFKEKKK